MLIYLTVASRDKATKKTGGLVVGTDFITEMVVSGTGARFKLLAQPENRRGSQDVVIVTNTVAEIRTAMDTANALTAITLRVFPDEDTTQATVYTVFNVAEIVRAWPDSTGFNTYMDVNEKGAIRRYLIDHYIYDLINYAETASTSTYTTT